MTGLPELSINEGLQAEAFDYCSLSEPLDVPEGTFFFCKALDFRGSLDEGYFEGCMTSPSSTSLDPLPLWPLFLFLSMASAENARVKAGVGG